MARGSAWPYDGRGDRRQHGNRKATWGVDVAMGHFDRTLSYINRLQDAESAAVVCETLLSVTSEFGLTALMAGTVPQPGTPTGQQKEHVLLCDWPVEWLERYVKRNYVDHDPVVSHIKQFQAPVQWREASRGVATCDGGGEVMGDAGAFKLRDGLAFPLITLDGQIAMVSLGGEKVADLDRGAVLTEAPDPGQRSGSDAGRGGMSSRSAEATRGLEKGKGGEATGTSLEQAAASDAA